MENTPPFRPGAQPPDDDTDRLHGATSDSGDIEPDPAAAIVATLDTLLDDPDQHEHANTAAWLVRYLNTFSEFLRECQVDERYLNPLRTAGIWLITAPSGTVSPTGDEVPDLDDHYCRASADISWFVMHGHDEQSAARKAARGLIAAGHPLPVQGGDPRGWVRLALWRETLRRKKSPEHLYTLYGHYLDVRREAHKATPPFSPEQAS